MQFLLTALGSYGDVHPIVGLGTALAARGHRVKVITNPYFEDVVTGAGVAAVVVLAWPASRPAARSPGVLRGRSLAGLTARSWPVNGPHGLPPEERRARPCASS